MSTRNPDRIDFTQTDLGTVVTRFWRIDGRQIAPNGAEVKAFFDLENALNWLTQHGLSMPG